MSKSKYFFSGGAGFLAPRLAHSLKEALPHAQVVLSQNLTSTIEFQKEIKDFSADSQARDCYFHLAGLSQPRACEAQPSIAWESNLTSALEAIRLLKANGFKGLYVFFSTAHVYSAKLEGPIQEDALKEPQGVYGWSKYLAEEALQAFRGDSRLLIVRLFNHSHRTQSADFFLPHIYHTLKNTKTTSVEIPVGNVQISRDFSTITSLEKRVLALAEKAENISDLEILNFSSGQARRLDRLITLMAQELGVSVTLKTDSNRVRAGEPETVFGNPEKSHHWLKTEPSHLSDLEFIKEFLK